MKSSSLPSSPLPAAQSAYADPGFSQAVIAWQQQYGRHTLPWQNTGDAYKIWLSEIMLQQTQVSAVIPYYQRFLQSFPTVADLASASSEDVMGHWSGLGYYSRARNLHQCAKQIVQNYAGVFPSDPALLAQLPGIGRSTAAAVTAFAYSTRAAILDGNVKRVMARVYGIDGFPGTSAIEKAMWLRAEALLPETGIAAYTQGLMDLGATLCTRNSPACPRCPLKQRCVAFLDGRTAELPVRKPKKIPKFKRVELMLLLHEDMVLLEQRPASGIWGGLLSLPEVAGMRDMNAVTVTRVQQSIDEDLFSQTEEPEFAGRDQHWAALESTVRNWSSQFASVTEIHPLPVFFHQFSHFKLEIEPVLVSLSQRYLHLGESRYIWYPRAQIEQAPLPAPVKALLLNLTM